MGTRGKYIVQLAVNRENNLESLPPLDKPPQVMVESDSEILLEAALLEDCLFEGDIGQEINMTQDPCNNFESIAVQEQHPLIENDVLPAQQYPNNLDFGVLKNISACNNEEVEQVIDPTWEPHEIEESNSSGNESENLEMEIYNLHEKNEEKSNAIDEVTTVSDAEEIENEGNEKQNKKKRQCNPQDWKKNARRKKRNSGEAYLSSRNVNVSERSILPPCKEQCLFKCTLKINEELRKTLFTRYWKLGDLYKQRQYILKHISQIEHSQTVQKIQRKNNNAFYFEIGNTRIRVCKLFFTRTLGISDRMVRTVIAKTSDGILEDDLRGKHGNQTKVSEEIKLGIVQHIESIPRIESHYLRAQTSREYIDGGKTLADIHRDYKANCLKNGKQFGNYTLFSRIFKNQFNISFFTPKKDQCGICEQFKNQMEKSDQLQANYDRHLREKELSRLKKSNDKERAKKKECFTACFDLQAVLQTPCGEITSFYYKSKLSTYNFTIFDLGSLNGFCFVWHEGEGNRGANEIGTCLYKFLKNESDKGLPVILYSDNCCGQNKNKFIASILLHSVKELNIPSITLKFLVVGHTQNEGDNMHSLIEKQKKRVLKSGPIYTPAQWIPVIANAKKTGMPYKIMEMNYSDFYDLKELQGNMGTNFAINEDGEKVMWHDIAMLKFEKEDPCRISYKNSYSDIFFKKIIIKKNARSATTVSMNNDIRLKQLYDVPLKISQNKLDALSDWCNKRHIIEKYHDFYKSLGCNINSMCNTATVQSKQKQKRKKQ